MIDQWDNNGQLVELIRMSESIRIGQKATKSLIDENKMLREENITMKR